VVLLRSVLNRFLLLVEILKRCLVVEWHTDRSCLFVVHLVTEDPDPKARPDDVRKFQAADESFVFWML
jgi:hypothetical protein